jgi:hypothetical protein
MYLAPAIAVFFPALGHLLFAKFAALALAPDDSAKARETRSGKAFLE